MPFVLTPEEKQYLARAMSKVSRSFALVVAQLEEPLDAFMATAYLICRVVDNIEDSQQVESWRRQRFAEFSRLLHDPALAPAILSGWQAEPWPGLTTDEQALMGVDDGAPLWQLYGRLPSPTRRAIAHWTGIMAQGMAHLDTPETPPHTLQHQGVHLLATEEDYNRYCYFVAGTVGHLGVDLVVAHYGLTDAVATALRASCEACGRGLQKTNIVKDFVDDLQRQVSYLPASWLSEIDYRPLALAGAPRAWKQKVIYDVLQELHEALAHVLSLPVAAAGYRKASLLCLLPALHTTLLAAQRCDSLFTPDHQIKLARPTMLQCMQDTQLLWPDNEAIRQHCRAIEQAVAKQFAE